MTLRVAVLSRNFSTTGGGAERYAVEVATRLAVDHEMHVFAQQAGPVPAGVTLHSVPMHLQRPRWINQIFFAAWTWWKTRRGFDVVHSHENTWHGNVQTVHVLPIRHTLFHGLTGVKRVLRWLKVVSSPRLVAYLLLEAARYSMRDPRRQVVVTSLSLSRVMASAYPATSAGLTVVTPGVAAAPGAASPEQQAAARRGLGLPSEGTCLLVVANDMRKKGLPTVLATLAELPAEVYLAVVGQSDQRGAMELLAQQSGVGARVFWLGAMKDVASAYQAANMLVHATLEDTYAMVVLEAMAYGLPVIVSDGRFCGISEELQTGINALLLSHPTDPGAVRTAISRLLMDPALRRSLADLGLDFARHHTWQSCVENYRRLYLLASDPKSEPALHQH